LRKVLGPSAFGARIIGSVDDLGRPVIRIDIQGRDGFLAVVDTGFNRSLMLMATEAKAMGFELTDSEEIVELGTTIKATVVPALGNIEWLGRTVRVEALVSSEPSVGSHPDVARALVGTELLADCLLLVDFRRRTVEIEAQD
jgi:predicted aspartyl protease